MWDGTGWYTAVPVPGAGAFRRQPLGGCDEAAVRALTGYRLNAHFLQSRLGALGGAAGRTLTGSRWCALCAAGYPEAGVAFSPANVPVEDVPHVFGACPGLAAERAGAVAELELAYPGFADRFAVLTPAARAEALVFTVPDGRWRSRAAGGGGVAARLRATRAVLGYVQSVAAALPEVGRSLWAMGR